MNASVDKIVEVVCKSKFNEAPIRKKFLKPDDEIWYLKDPYINTKGKLVKTLPVLFCYEGFDLGKTIWSYENKSGGTSFKKLYRSLKDLQNSNNISRSYAHLLEMMDHKALAVVKGTWEEKEKEVIKLAKEMDKLLKVQIIEANLYLSRSKTYYADKADEQESINEL